MNQLLIDTTGSIAGLIFALIILRRLSLPTTLSSMIHTIRRSLSVIASPRISDHWKERAVPAYATRLLKHSLVMTLGIALVVVSFSAGFIIVLALIEGNIEPASRRLLHWQPQLVTVILAIVYATVTARRGDSIYGPLERTLHELALGNAMTPQLIFSIERRLPQRRYISPRPVYVTGLARAGTTVLLNALHATDTFATLNYTNMPFVTAPRLWTSTMKPFRRRIARHERAHGDGVLVDDQSPEAFEEVFWLMRCRPDYVKQAGLVPHTPPDSAIRDYRDFVRSVITASGNAHHRYLAKNNNNLLRLASLHHAFPDAVIVLPFRAPVAHATSLLTQHRRFLDIHRRDSFSASYMTWLGHFEFGGNMKPLLLPGVEGELQGKDPLSLEYWLHYWFATYRFVAEIPANNIILFDYDLLTQEPERQLARLAGAINCPTPSLTSFSDQIRRTDPEPARLCGIEPIDNLYQTLRVRAVQ